MDATSSRRVFLGVEQSATGRVWRDRLDERGALRSLSIVQRHGLPELLARIVAGRGIEADAVEPFLDPTIKRLMPDPNSLTAMDAAAKRIADAVMRREAIAIFGDYDVDGATASALLGSYLRLAGHEPLSVAARLGLDVIVIDHHQADEQLPPALAVVNPNRLDDLSRLGHLAAVGVT